MDRTTKYGLMFIRFIDTCSCVFFGQLLHQYLTNKPLNSITIITILGCLTLSNFVKELEFKR